VAVPWARLGALSAGRLVLGTLAFVLAVGLPAPGVASTTAIPPCHETAGRLLVASFPSRIAGGAVPYRIYLPPCYASSGRRYPYLILLHGWPGDAGTWTRDLHVDAALTAGIRTHTLPPMVVVMPDGGGPEQSGTVAPGRSFESEIVSELMPAIQHRWCVQAVPPGRAIGGISRGGWWALLTAFREPSLFTAVGGHSPYLEVISPDSAFDVDTLARSVPLPPAGALRLWLDAGAEDYARPGTERLVAVLRSRRLRFAYTVFPGDHDDAYWARHESQYLAFYGATWPKSAAALPRC
jgi:enterochelin esterase-like enzyme